MPFTVPDKLPIGWYLKEADSLITQYVNASFESFGINRFHWQLIKNISLHGKICQSLYYHQVSRFMTEAELAEIFASLVERHWIAQDGDMYSFTEAGKTAFALIEEKQMENRKHMMEGTTQEEYDITIGFLERVIRNMGGKI
jgi:hypothetical protein